MVARRKKPVSKTTRPPWEQLYADLFKVPDNWTLPTHVKVVQGAKSGTLTAHFKDEHGTSVEGFLRFRAKAGKWVVYDAGLRMVHKFKILAVAK